VPEATSREALPEGLSPAGEGFAARSRIKYLLRLGLDGIIVGGMMAVNRGCIRAAGTQ
jgi:hypothetical protein